MRESIQEIHLNLLKRDPSAHTKNYIDDVSVLSDDVRSSIVVGRRESVHTGEEPLALET